MATKKAKPEEVVATSTQQAQVAKPVQQNNNAEPKPKKPKRNIQDVINFKKSQIENNKDSMVVVASKGSAVLLARLANEVEFILRRSKKEEINHAISIDYIMAETKIRRAIINLSDILSDVAKSLNKEYREKDYIKLQREELEATEKALGQINA